MVFPEPFRNMIGVGGFAGGQNDPTPLGERTVDEIGGEPPGKFRHGLLFGFRIGAESRRDAETVPFRREALLNADKFRLEEAVRLKFSKKRLPVGLGLRSAVFPDRLQALVRRIEDQETVGRVIGEVEIAVKPFDRLASGAGDDLAGVDGADGTAGLWGIFAHGFQLVAEIFDPDRELHAGRKDVEDSAAAGEFPHCHRLRFIVVAKRGEVGGEL